MWVDDLSEMSQKKKLGNVYIYYVYFLPFKFFPLCRDLEAFIAFSYGQIQLLKAHNCVVDPLLPLLQNNRLMLKPY